MHNKLTKILGMDGLNTLEHLLNDTASPEGSEWCCRLFALLALDGDVAFGRRLRVDRRGAADDDAHLETGRRRR